MADWREGSFCMKFLVGKLYRRPLDSSYTDVTFRLPDGSSVAAHRLVLALASPFFEAQFFGLLSSDIPGPVEIKDVESNAFRRVLEFIYNSGEIDWEATESLDYWSLMQAAHMYLVPGLIELCNEKLSDFLIKIRDNKELVDHVNRASQLYIYEDILKFGLEEIKARLKDIICTDSWLSLQESVVLEVLKDQKLKVSEGRLFEGMIDWCMANCPDRPTAIRTFQSKFADKVLVKNMSKDTFIRTIGESDFISPELFKNWTFEIMKNQSVKIDATRFALYPLKVQQTMICRQDFLEQRVGPVNPLPGEDQPDSELWRAADEFEDVSIRIRIFQKVSSVTEGVAPRAKFGILLETHHLAKPNANKSAIRERVSVKMVAKKEDGTVVKKLFKPIEDSVKEGMDSRNNIFVLSKNKEERIHWHVMEIVVIIDRRPTCHIKGITGEEFARTVCMGQTRAYLQKAKSYYYDVNLSIKSAVEDIARKLNVKEDSSLLSQWLYIFTKGYVSNLRSRRAMPNDYWTAETVEDYMRCKVINFPIGVHNEAMRRDAFRTWIISQKLADEKEKDKKNVFVCTYNPETQAVRFEKYLPLSVETKVETLGLLEHISLGTVKVTDDFFRQVTFGTAVTPGARIFIRRIFPIQDENDEKMMQKVIVTEAVKGESLTHIDDCHVLVIQEHKKAPNCVDFDKFLLSRIREVKVIFQHLENAALKLEVMLDPEKTVGDIITKLGEVAEIETDQLEVYKCFSSKSMQERASETPVDLGVKEPLSSLFEYCTKDHRKLFFRRKSFAPAAENSPLEEGSQVKPDEENWLDDMETESA